MIIRGSAEGFLFVPGKSPVGAKSLGTIGFIAFIAFRCWLRVWSCSEFVSISHVALCGNNAARFQQEIKPPPSLPLRSRHIPKQFLVPYQQHSGAKPVFAI